MGLAVRWRVSEGYLRNMYENPPYYPRCCCCLLICETQLLRDLGLPNELARATLVVICIPASSSAGKLSMPTCPIHTRRVCIGEELLAWYEAECRLLRP